MTVAFPFAGRVVDYVERKKVVTERVLRLSEDLFLEDHLLARGAAGPKPAAHCFPVVPLAMLMEVMAEVAALLAPGCGLTSFENVQAMHWVGLRGTDALTLQASACVVESPGPTAAVRIKVALFADGNEEPNATGVVLFGRRYEKTLELAFPAPQNPQAYPLSGAEIYDQRQLFHGPTFQTITGRPTLANSAVTGLLSTLPRDGLLRSIREPQLLIDPVLLDGALQLFALWAMQYGGGAYPVGARKVELYCPPPATGSKVPAYIQITHRAYRLLEGNIEIQDGAGHVWLRARGWKAWLFHWPSRVSDFLRAPTRHCLSRELPSPNPGPKAAARCVEKTDLGDLAASACADHYLHIDETRRFDELSRMPEKQLEWVLGRIVAKDAARCLLVAETGGEMLHPASFTIEDGENGDVVARNLPSSGAAPILELTRANGRTVCTARFGPPRNVPAEPQ